MTHIKQIQKSVLFYHKNRIFSKVIERFRSPKIVALFPISIADYSLNKLSDYLMIRLTLCILYKTYVPEFTKVFSGIYIISSGYCE